MLTGIIKPKTPLGNGFSQKGRGYIPGLHDKRDHKYITMKTYPTHQKKVDLRGTIAMPRIWDQGKLGSCTAHGSNRVYSFAQGLKYGPNPDDFEPSCLFTYYNTRNIEGTVSQDAGGEVRDAVKSLSIFGCPPLKVVPYDISKFTKKPEQFAYDVAKNQLSTEYLSIDVDANPMKTCLEEGFPFVFGMTLYSSFDTQQTTQDGIIPVPVPNEDVDGGHCMACVGYEETPKRDIYIIANSWGTDWGDNGYCYIRQN